MLLIETASSDGMFVVRGYTPVELEVELAPLVACISRTPPGLPPTEAGPANSEPWRDPASSDPRASDQDRERVAHDLREHFAAGRLTDAELSDRMSAAYGARTISELHSVRADLPPLPPTPAEQQAHLAARRCDLRRRLLQHSGRALAPFAICTVIWLATGATGMFWPMWVAFVAVAVLARNAWRLYGPAPELGRLERELVRQESDEGGLISSARTSDLAGRECLIWSALVGSRAGYRCSLGEVDTKKPFVQVERSRRD
jgi:hypothetical protein